MATANVVQTSISGGHSNALAIQGDGAFLPKLATTSRIALSLGTPDKGLMVYDTTIASICVWNGTAWEFINDSGNSWAVATDFGSMVSGTDVTATMTAAMASGKSILIPAGQYGISATLETSADYQRVMSVNGPVTFFKYANTPILHLKHQYSGASNISFYGNYDAFGFLVRPAGAPIFTDTTDGVLIGVVGTGTPYFWNLTDCTFNFHGRDGIHWNDGPSGQMQGVVNVFYNARWGFWSEQIASLGGAAIDTAHSVSSLLHSVSNGRSTYTEGGGILLRGGSHNLNTKTFGNWGDGLRTNCGFARAKLFTELDGSVNTSITTWAAGQVISAVGTMRRYGINVYVSTNTGTTGGTPPTNTSGTQSDGVVVWQYRSGYGLAVESNAKNQNVIDLLYSNGIHTVASGNTLSGSTLDGQSVKPVNNLLNAKSLQVSREIDIGDPATAYPLYNNVSLVARTNADNEFDYSHYVTGSGAINVNWGFGGSTNFPLRLRGSDYGHIAEMSLGSRVKYINSGDSYSLFSEDVSVADVYVCNSNLGTGSGFFEFNLATGGTNILPGRRLVIIKAFAGGVNVGIYGTGSTSLGSLGFGFPPFHTLSNQYDWLELIYLGSNLWWAKMKKAGVLS